MYVVDKEMELLKEQKEHYFKIGLIVAGITLALVIGAVSLFYTKNIFLEGAVYSKETVVLNLSGSDMEDFSALGKLTYLERIDLTHTSFKDFSILDNCHVLRKVVIKDRVIPAEQCVAFYDAHPEAQIIGRVLLADQEFDYDTEELTITDITHEELLQLSALRYLKKLDVTYCDVSDEDYDYLKKRLPECDILRLLTFNEKDYSNDVKTVKISKDISDQELERVRYFPHLEEIDATSFTDTEAIEVLKEKFPYCRIKWAFRVLGIKTNSTVQTLDLRGKKLTLDQVREALNSSVMANFYDLKAVDLCGCGLTNQQMEDLQQQFSQLKFIWYVYFGGHPVRTDAKVLSTTDFQEHYSSKDFEQVFQYCTELVALDLSENRLEDLGNIGNLKQLRALTLTHNPLRRLTGLQQLTNLEYLEADNTYVTNIACLTNLSKLKYVNLYGKIGSGLWVRDISPLENHPQLSLAVFDVSVPEKSRDSFFRSNPDCDAEFNATMKDGIMRNTKWCENPYRKTLYQAFEKWTSVTDYDPVLEEFVFSSKNNLYK